MVEVERQNSLSHEKFRKQETEPSAIRFDVRNISTPSLTVYTSSGHQRHTLPIAHLLDSDSPHSKIRLNCIADTITKMAGGGYHPYKADPALDRWQNMHSTMYQRFRLTPSKTRAVVLWGFAVPVLMYYAAQYTDVSASHGIGTRWSA